MDLIVSGMNEFVNNRLKTLPTRKLQAEQVISAYGKGALLTHVAPSPGLLTPSAGYTFSWTGVSGGIGSTIGVSSFRMESLKAERVEAEMAFDNKVIGSDLGYFWSSIVA